MMEVDRAAAAQAVVPWVEKYRPKTLEDVAAHKDIVDTGKEETNKTTFPSIVFEEITPYSN